MAIFSYHAIQKLNVYNISQEEILVAMNENIYYNCEDLITKKLIVIFEYKNRLFAAVKDSENEFVITIYPTTQEVINQRIKNKRWDCE